MKVEKTIAPGCVVLDIDDTIIKADPSSIGVYKVYPDGHEERLSTDEFAKDPDVKAGTPGITFDYREFRDPEKVIKSLENGTPLIKNLKIMDKYVNRGWDVVFLTARGLEDLLYNFLSDNLMYKDTSGKLRKLGSRLNREFSAAINDEFKVYPGINDGDKKARVLTNLCRYYDKVLFVDDDEKNLQAAKELRLPNLKLVRSWTEGLEVL